MLSKFEKILTGFKIFKKDKRFIKNILKGVRSLASYQLNTTIKNYCEDFKTIIDVGANIGQFTVAASEIFPNAEIYSFEPVKEIFEKLKKNTVNLRNVRIFNEALGTAEGKIKFYKNQYSHASSVLPIHKNQTRLIPETSETKIIEVEINRLENFFKNNFFDKPILLKLDVQGFEKEVIMGAGSRLSEIDYLLFETSFMEMYEGEPLFEEMHKFVKDAGYNLIAPVGFFQTSNFQILQMDLLYKRMSK